MSVCQHPKYNRTIPRNHITRVMRSMLKFSLNPVGSAYEWHRPSEAMVSSAHKLMVRSASGPSTHLSSLGMMGVIVILMNHRNHFRSIYDRSAQGTGFPGSQLSKAALPNANGRRSR